MEKPIRLAGPALLQLVVEDQRQIEGGRDDFGGLAGARQRAGEQRVGLDLAGGGEPVAQMLRLRASMRRESAVALHAGERRIAVDIGVCLAVADQIKVRHVSPRVLVLSNNSLYRRSVHHSAARILPVRSAYSCGGSSWRPALGSIGV